MGVCLRMEAAQNAAAGRTVEVGLCLRKEAAQKTAAGRTKQGRQVEHGVVRVQQAANQRVVNLGAGCSSATAGGVTRFVTRQ